MKPLIYAAAITAAFITVLSTRLVVPALIILFRAIEQSFAPSADALPAAITAEAEPNSKPRRARRRKPSAKTLAAIEAIA